MVQKSNLSLVLVGSVYGSVHSIDAPECDRTIFWYTFYYGKMCPPITSSSNLSDPDNRRRDRLICLLILFPLDLTIKPKYELTRRGGFYRYLWRETSQFNKPALIPTVDVYNPVGVCSR
ncbi:hypothetical protein [Coleofasciculus chthonoplastes]|uniref:hypothetical protein n=1 Tax=Coleofasciculus chthonoplastes TaxID=64178 RepID=UPI0032F3B1F9